MPPKQGYSLTPYKGGRGQWRVKVSMGRDPLTGRQRQRSKVITARNITEARRQAQAWAANLRPDPETVTFSRVLDEFLLHSEAERDPSTVRGYRSKVEHWIRPGLGSTRLSDLDRKKLAAWRRSLSQADIKPRTANQAIAIVKAAIRWADRNGYPADLTALPVLQLLRVDEPDIEPPDTADVVSVLAEVMTRDETFGLMLWLTAVTGCRRGELAGLRWEDFDGTTVRIRRSIDQSGKPKTTKTKQQRQITLDPATAALLEEHRRQETARWQIHTGLSAARREGWIFPSPLDWEKPRSVDSISHRLASLRGDRRVWLHGLRHGVATILIAAGVDPRTVSARLGHARTSVTMDVYTAPVSAQDRHAATVIAGHLRELMTDTPSGER